MYNLPLQIQTIEGPLQYKIAPLTPPNLDPYYLALLQSTNYYKALQSLLQS